MGNLDRREGDELFWFMFILGMITMFIAFLVEQDLINFI